MIVNLSNIAAEKEINSLPSQEKTWEDLARDLYHREINEVFKTVLWPKDNQNVFLKLWGQNIYLEQDEIARPNSL